MKKIIITAGGTGGHIFPALAIYKELEKQGNDVCFVSDKRSRNYNLDIKLKEIIAISPSGGIKNKIKSLFTIFGVMQSLILILKFRPDIVIGFGGYPSLPMLIAAIISRRKIVLHEQNAYCGKVNRLLSKYAKLLLTSFKETFGVSSKALFVGNPVRKEISDLATKKKKTSTKINILVFGGSQGSKIFSQIIPKAIASLPKELRKNIIITQQARKEDIDEVRDFYKDIKVNCEVKSFFSNMASLLHIADIVIARSGAGTISELTAMGRASILIPYKFAADNHQKYNAESLVKNNAAIMIEQDELNSEILSKQINSLLLDNKKDKLESNAKEMGKRNAVDEFISALKSI